jgi:tetratricopeptide (TPR) repeat protein
MEYLKQRLSRIDPPLKRLHDRAFQFFPRILHYLELFFAGYTILVALLSAYQLITEIVPFFEQAHHEGFHEVFEGRLSDLLLLAVAVELAIMLLVRTPRSVINVLFFVVARKMLIKAHSFTDLLFGVLALAGLFATRKYLEYVAYDFRRFQIAAGEALTMSSGSLAYRVLAQWNRIKGYVDDHADRKLAGDLFEIVCKLMNRYGSPRETSKTFNRLINLREDDGDQGKLATSLASYGQFLRQSGELTEAESVLRRSLDIRRKSQARLRTAESETLVAELAYVRGHLADAQDTYERARETYSEAGYELGLGVCFRGLGDIACAKGDFGIAREAYDKALKSHRRDGDEAHIVRDLTAVGLVNIQLENLTMAESTLNEALEMCQRSELSQELAEVVIGLTQVYIENSDLAAAHEALDDGFTLLSRSNNLLLSLRAQRLKALLLLRNGKARQARRLLLKLAKTAGDRGFVLFENQVQDEIRIAD